MAFDKKKTAYLAYAPYLKEGAYCLKISVLVLIILLLAGCVSAIFLDIRLFFICLGVMILFVVAEIFLNFRICVALLSEKRKDWDIRTLTILKIKDEFSFSGGRHGESSVIHKLYPKNDRVGKYRLICLGANGETVKLRTVMSGKKFQLIQDRINSDLPTLCKIHYGKHSRIVMLYESSEMWTDKLNHMF